MRALRLVLISILGLTLAAPSATASHGGIHPTFRREATYFHCNGDTKIYQVNWLHQVGAETSFVPWNTTPPSQSVQQGAGCGSVEWGGVTNDFYDAVFAGTFKGNLRDLTVRIHNLATSQARQTSTYTLRLYAEVDGISIFPKGSTEALYEGRTVTVTPVKANSGATELFEFSITDIGFARNVVDANGNVVGVETGGVAKEDGDGAEEHTLKLFVGAHGTVFGDDPTGKVGAWVWDTTEVPSGIEFNPTTLAAAKVKADTPVYEEPPANLI